MGYFDNLLDRVERKVNNIISTAKSAAVDVYNSVVGTDETKVKQDSNAQKPSVPSSVVNPTGKLVSEVGDTYNSKSNAKVDEPKQQKITPKKEQKKNADAQTGIEIKIKSLTSKSSLSEETVRAELKGLSAEKQAEKLTEIDNEWQRLQKDKKAGLIAGNVDEDKYVIESAKNNIEAKSKGVISDKKDAKKFHFIKRMKTILGSDFNQLSPAEQNERIELVKNTLKQEIQTDLYKNASKTRKKWLEANKQIIDYAIERQLQLAFLAVTNEREEESVRFRNGHDIEDAKQLALSIKTNSTEIADRMTADWDMQLLKYFNEAGQMPTAKEFGAGVKVSTSQMSSSAVMAYEQRSFELKQNFYNGNPDYDFLTEEYYTEATTAVGLGITTNVNMSAEEKASALKTWDSHAQQFSDYDEVRSKYYTELKEYVKNHPEAKQGIDDIKTKYFEKYGRMPAYPKSAIKRYESNMKTNESNNVSTTQEEVQPAESKATPEQLEKSLLKYGYKATENRYKKNTKRDFAEAVVHNPKLSCFRQNVIDYLIALPPEDLSEIMDGCSTEMFLFVLRNVSPNKAGRLYDLSKSDKCYDARILGEKIIEESQNYALS